MKISTNKNFHLTYCTNIHPGEEWNKVFDNLKQYIPSLRAQLVNSNPQLLQEVGDFAAHQNPFGIGLRLADVAAKELLQGNNLTEFQSWLSDRNLYVFTLNGFPFGGFHWQVVKDQVYAPDWSKQERLDYTIKLVHILAQLLPSGVEGSISTLPLSYKPWFKGNQLFQASVTSSSTLRIAELVAEMIKIRQETGKNIHLDLEPEPDGLLENSAEVIDYFQTYLLPIGGDYLVKHLGISFEAAELHLLNHVRVCYDTCHFAVEYEDPRTVFDKFKLAGIQVGKIQISAALQVKIPTQLKQRRLIKEKLLPFAESTYLHQVIARESHGKLYRYRDLEQALPDLENTKASEWRIHFHVPIFIKNYQLFQSTQDDITTVLELLQHNRACDHLEIETYTWEVLPKEMKLDLPSSLQREYEWVLSKIVANSRNLLASIN
jgi:hypothetical protein